MTVLTEARPVGHLDYDYPALNPENGDLSAIHETGPTTPDYSVSFEQRHHHQPPSTELGNEHGELGQTVQTCHLVNGELVAINSDNNSEAQPGFTPQDEAQRTMLAKILQKGEGFIEVKSNTAKDEWLIYSFEQSADDHGQEIWVITANLEKREAGAEDKRLYEVRGGIPYAHEGAYEGKEMDGLSDEQQTAVRQAASGGSAEVTLSNPLGSDDLKQSFLVFTYEFAGNSPDGHPLISLSFQEVTKPVKSEKNQQDDADPNPTPPPEVAPDNTSDDPIKPLLESPDGDNPTAEPNQPAESGDSAEPPKVIPNENLNDPVKLSTELLKDDDPTPEPDDSAVSPSTRPAASPESATDKERSDSGSIPNKDPEGVDSDDTSELDNPELADALADAEPVEPEFQDNPDEPRLDTDSQVELSPEEENDTADSQPSAATPPQIPPVGPAITTIDQQPRSFDSPVSTNDKSTTLQAESVAPFAETAPDHNLQASSATDITKTTAIAAARQQLDQLLVEDTTQVRPIEVSQPVIADKNEQISLQSNQTEQQSTVPAEAVIAKPVEASALVEAVAIDKPTIAQAATIEPITNAAPALTSQLSLEPKAERQAASAPASATEAVIATETTQSTLTPPIDESPLTTTPVASPDTFNHVYHGPVATTPLVEKVKTSRPESQNPLRVLSSAPPLKIFSDYRKTFSGAAPADATRGWGFETQPSQNWQTPHSTEPVITLKQSSDTANSSFDKATASIKQPSVNLISFGGQAYLTAEGDLVVSLNASNIPSTPAKVRRQQQAVA